MFSVIIYALKVDHQYTVGHKEIETKVGKLLDEFNRQGGRSGGLVWRLSSDQFWISFSRGSLEG